MLHPLSKEESIIEDYRNKGAKLLVSASILLANMPKIIDSEMEILSLPIKSSLPFVKKLLYPLVNKTDRIDYRKYPRIHCFDDYRSIDETYISYPSTEGRIYLGSGGTSGKEKSIVLSDFAFLSLTKATPKIIGRLDGDFTNLQMFSALPLFHGFGLSIGIMTMLYYGGNDFLVPKFRSRKAVEALKRNKKTIFVGVPAMYQAMINNKDFSGEKLKNILVSFVGGDFIPPTLFEAFEGRIRSYGGNSYLHEGYGLTETVTVNSVNTDAEHKKGSIGKTIDGVKALIINDEGEILSANEPGEIVVSGPTLMNGYLEGENPFVDIDGVRYVKTGDLGKMDEDGYLYFLSRKKRTIKKKGFNIYPLLVEKEVSSLPEIKECAYLSRFGEKEEETFLFVHLADGIDQKTAEERIVSCIKEKFYDYVVPNHLLFVGKFPRTKVAKMDTKALWEYVK